VAYRYELLTTDRAGEERRHAYTSEEPLAPGSVVPFGGRYWLVARVEPGTDGAPERAVAAPARYRVRLRHPDGREEVGAFRRFRPGAPRLGHAFATVEDGEPASWQVVAELVAEDDRGRPYLDHVAERDFGEFDAVPDHELEHAVEARDDEGLLPGALAALSQAGAAGLSIELVALEAGEEPDWVEAERYLDALILEEIEDDLLELCGVRPGRDPRDAWLGIVKERLRVDLERFRSDVETDHDQVERWDFRGGRVYAAVGDADDEADPESPFGWLCRLVDVGALTAAGFRRVRKAELSLDE
jgi:hypothetical protein